MTDRDDPADDRGAAAAAGAALDEAGVLRVEGLLGEAFTRLTAARDHAVAAREPRLLGEVELALGQVSAAFGDLSEARSWLDAAGERFAATEDEVGTARVLLELARLDARNGSLEQAKAQLRRCLERAKRAEATDVTAWGHLELAAVGAEAGDLRIAQLDLRAALASPVAGDDSALRAEGALVAADLAARAGDVTTVDVRLAEALDLLPDDDPRRTALLDERAAMAGGSTPAGGYRRPVTAAVPATTAVGFAVATLDVDGELDRVALLAPDDLPDADDRQLVRGILAPRTAPIDGFRNSSLTLYPSEHVHGLAAVRLDVGDVPVALAVLCAGVDPDEERVLRDIDPWVSYVAGRAATHTTMGFGRHLLLRPSALSTVTERPIAFLRTLPGVGNPPVMAAAGELLTAVAASWFAMIAEDGPGAHRLRETRVPLPGPDDPDAADGW
ncbi:MAG: hypothetical protein U0Q07_19645 [Acidimicrobiales bacterium]